MYKTARVALGVSLFFLAVTLVVTYPLPLHVADALPGAPGDNFENLFRLRFFADAVAQGRVWPLASDAIYYPFGYDLRYADTTLINLTLGLPIVLLAGETVAYNMLILAGFALGGLSAYLLARLLTANGSSNQHGPALVAGLLYAFSTYHVYRVGVGHLNHAAAFLLPLIFLYIELGLRRRQARWGALAGLHYALTGLSTWNNAFVVAVGIFVYVVARAWPLRKALSDSELWRPQAAFFVVAAAILGPLAVLMLAANRDAGLGFSLAEADQFAGDLLATLAFNPAHPLASARVLSPGFIPPLGWVGTGLALTGLFRCRNRLLVAFTAMLLAAVILSWGPTLHWNGERLYIPAPPVVESLFARVMATLTERLALHPQSFWDIHRPGAIFIPLPAYVLFLFVPFFNALREWANFAVLMPVAVAVLAAFGLAGVPNYRRTAMAAGAALLALAELMPLPFAYGYSDTASQPLTRWLGEQGSGAVVARFPIAAWTNGATLYDGYSSGSAFTDGYAPYQPAGWRQAFPLLDRFPAPESIQALRSWRVRYVVVSPLAYGLVWPSVKAPIDTTAELRLLATVPLLSRFRSARLTPPGPASPGAYVPVAEWSPHPAGTVLDTLLIYELAP